MNEYEVSDYGIFNDAVATTSALNTSVQEAQETVTETMSKLGDESIFMGPAADFFLANTTIINNEMTTTTDNFNKINTYIQDVAKAYAAGDTQASSVVLNLTSTQGTTTAVASDYNNPGNLSGSNLEFVNSIKDGAVDAYNKYGVLPSLTMAQAILESGWGKHKIGNNIFGIKAGSNWTGKTINCKTGEQNADGSRYTINADFRDYDSVSDSIVDHAELLTMDRYKKVIDSKNYKDACVAVRECGYATSLDYSQNLISIVEQYGLDQWDPK